MERKIFACVFLGLTTTFSFATGERQVYPKQKEHSRPYAFSYGIKDAYAGNDYERSEVSDGDHVTGSYTVQLPDGRKQIVKYEADHDKGFVADVSYYGEAKYPPPHLQDHITKFPPPVLHNIKPILPKYKPKLTPHAIPIKPFHSEYVPSKPEFHIQQVLPINKPKLQKLQNYVPSSKPNHSFQHTPEIRPYKMPIKSVYTEYKPSVSQHEQFDKPFSQEYKPKRPHKPIRPMSGYQPHKLITSEFKPHKQVISGYNPEKPFKPMYLDNEAGKPHTPIMSNFHPEIPHKPIISEYKPEKPFRPMHLDYEPEIPHKPIQPEYKPEKPHKPFNSEYKPDKPFMPMHLDYEPDKPHKPIISDYKPEMPFPAMNLDYESDIPHEPIFEYKPDVPHQPTIPEYVPEIPHKDAAPILEETIYSKVKAKRQKFPPYFPDKGPTKLPEISPFLTLKDIPLENSHIEENHDFKQSNAHVKPIHNLASISIYTPIKPSTIPSKNFEDLDPSIIAEDIPILKNEHGHQPNFDSGPLFKDGLDANYKSFPDSHFQHKQSNQAPKPQFPDENNFDKKLSFSQEQMGLGPDFRSDIQNTVKDPFLKNKDENEELKNHEEKSTNKENETIRRERESQQKAESDSQLGQLEVLNSKKIGIKKFVRPSEATSRRTNVELRKPVVKRDMKPDFGERITES